MRRDVTARKIGFKTEMYESNVTDQTHNEKQPVEETNDSSTQALVSFSPTSTPPIDVAGHFALTLSRNQDFLRNLLLIGHTKLSLKEVIGICETTIKD
ncbi:MAG: hypothetical protein M1836_004140 [Candelina mexicana]|nr:MAG: hypothetical protein M1836_004140 [Candelina mexicana]